MFSITIDNNQEIKVNIDVENPIQLAAETYATLCILTNQWKEFMESNGYPSDSFTFADLLDILSGFAKDFPPDDKDIDIFSNITMEYDSNRGYRYYITTDKDKVITFPVKEYKN